MTTPDALDAVIAVIYLVLTLWMLRRGNRLPTSFR